MCKWGTSTDVYCPAGFSGNTARTTVPIDSCIADIVKALNDAGILTIISCCGHGKGLGAIGLADGRALLTSCVKRNADGTIEIEMTPGPLPARITACRTDVPEPKGKCAGNDGSADATT